MATTTSRSSDSSSTKRIVCKRHHLRTRTQRVRLEKTITRQYVGHDRAATTSFGSVGRGGSAPDAGLDLGGFRLELVGQVEQLLREACFIVLGDLSKLFCLLSQVSNLFFGHNNGVHRCFF